MTCAHFFSHNSLSSGASALQYLDPHIGSTRTHGVFAVTSASTPVGFPHLAAGEFSGILLLLPSCDLSSQCLSPFTIPAVYVLCTD
jgi:hypothetical protein